MIWPTFQWAIKAGHRERRRGGGGFTDGVLSRHVMRWGSGSAVAPAAAASLDLNWSLAWISAFTQNNKSQTTWHKSQQAAVGRTNCPGRAREHTESLRPGPVRSRPPAGKCKIMTTAFAVSQTQRSLGSSLDLAAGSPFPDVCLSSAPLPHLFCTSSTPLLHLFFTSTAPPSTPLSLLPVCLYACCLPRFASVKVNSKLLLAKLLWRLVATLPCLSSTPLPHSVLPPPCCAAEFIVCGVCAFRTLQTRLSFSLSVGLINCNWCNFVASIFALSFSWISFCFGHVCSCSFSFAAAAPIPPPALHCFAFNFKPDCSYIKTFDCMGKREQD